MSRDAIAYVGCVVSLVAAAVLLLCFGLTGGCAWDDNAACEAACRRLALLGCQLGQGSVGACAQACSEQEQAGASLETECVAEAVSCEVVDACYGEQ